ncbi:MAG TPA: hypothetical protein VG621_03390 [Candidatus Paceibacterota bacterium]|nr:hypothetical protein [Candidatus Paceibacterota bacterium]
MSKSPVYLGGKNYNGIRNTEGWEHLDTTERASKIVRTKLSKDDDIDDFAEETEFEDVHQRLKDADEMNEGNY